ncbi:TIGR03086 family metal-binding protein [Actinocrinis sp.]|uniref:TIGR03086 family metal-binding protein n=1 Tax=Actinocrinis sp. TaxID=1920516 RepID=UPI002CE30B55|nr:TIGR03086 family metal-binding protein [Actinocrinis sp.]HXR69360.1 TIGR03086 family metal-binding protein [Actinocrinis sp.]
MNAFTVTGLATAALLERSLSYALGCVNEVTPADLANPTPCAQWDLRALLWHVSDSLSALIEGGAYGSIQLGVPANSPDPLAQFRGRAAAVLGAWSDPAMQRPIKLGDAALPPAVVASVGALEIAVHGWDIARSRRAPRPIPESLAADLLPLGPPLIGAAGRTAMFAPAVRVPDTASAGDRLLALVGRQPHG